MGYSKSDKAETHSRIVSVAARRFRELGLEGIGVADVMKEAGVTVGGFYKHFHSRDELVLEALCSVTCHGRVDRRKPCIPRDSSAAWHTRQALFRQLEPLIGAPVRFS